MNNMTLKIIDQSGRITLPKDMRKKVEFQEGDVIKLQTKDGSIVLTKVGILDQHGNTIKELKMNIQNALSYLDEKERIKIIESILKTLERND